MGTAAMLMMVTLKHYQLMPMPMPMLMLVPVLMLMLMLMQHFQPLEMNLP